MNILITGSHGYIGSSFINQCKTKYKFEKFSLLIQKLEDINFNGVDVVLHCAALVHQKAEQPYKKYYEINCKYPVDLAKLAKQNGVRQFVFISSIAVYGDDRELLDEQTPCAPVTRYGKSKLEAEQQLLKLNDENFIVSIIRPPMIYGKDAPGNIRSLVQLVEKVSVIPLGGIKNKRSFMYISNLCHLVDVVIEQEKSGVFLACDNEALSTTKLIELIAKELNKKIYLLKIPFFEQLLQLLKPSFHKRLYKSLEVDSTQTKKRLLGDAQASLPFSVEEGIHFMIRGEKS